MKTKLWIIGLISTVTIVVGVGHQVHKRQVEEQEAQARARKESEEEKARIFVQELEARRYEDAHRESERARQQWSDFAQNLSRQSEDQRRYLEALSLQQQQIEAQREANRSNQSKPSVSLSDQAKLDQFYRDIHRSVELQEDENLRRELRR